MQFYNIQQYNFQHFCHNTSDSIFVLWILLSKHETRAINLIILSSNDVFSNENISVSNKSIKIQQLSSCSENFRKNNQITRKYKQLMEIGKVNQLFQWNLYSQNCVMIKGSIKSSKLSSNSNSIFFDWFPLEALVQFLEVIAQFRITFSSWKHLSLII